MCLKYKNIPSFMRLVRDKEFRWRLSTPPPTTTRKVRWVLFKSMIAGDVLPRKSTGQFRLVISPVILHQVWKNTFPLRKRFVSTDTNLILNISRMSVPFATYKWLYFKTHHETLYKNINKLSSSSLARQPLEGPDLLKEFCPFVSVEGDFLSILGP
jgi:hypothetical protein